MLRHEKYREMDREMGTNRSERKELTCNYCLEAVR